MVSAVSPSWPPSEEPLIRKFKTIGAMKNRIAHQSPLLRSCNLLMPTIREETTRQAKKITNSSQLNRNERTRETTRPPRDCGGHPELRAADAAPVAEKQPDQTGWRHDRPRRASKAPSSGMIAHSCISAAV